MPDKTNGHVVYSYKLLPGAEEAIYDRISDITISMKSADHLKMPELVNSRYMVHLDEPELEKYERMKRNLLLQLPEGEVTAANAAALSGKLSQMANGAVYSDDGDYEKIHDRKLDALEDIIEAANGKPVLAAYWYQHDLERIQDRLSGLKIGFARLDQERISGGGMRGKSLWADPSGIRRTRPEPSERWEYPGVVRAYMEPGTVPADGGEALAAGTERDGVCDPHPCGENH